MWRRPDRYLGSVTTDDPWDEELKAKVEKLKASLEELAKLPPERKRQLKEGIQLGREAAAFAENMVPAGKYTEEETDARRLLWNLFAQLEKWFTVENRDAWTKRLAKELNRPPEWVREVLGW